MKDYHCDRCKKEIKGINGIHRIALSGAEVVKSTDLCLSIEWKHRKGVPGDYMLCEDCAEEIEAFALGNASVKANVDPAPMRPVVRERQRSFIDLARVGTLLKAGWIIDEAAADIGCSVDEVLRAAGLKASDITSMILDRKGINI